MTKRLILCDCSGSQSLDPAGIEAATGLACSKVHSALCTTQVEAAATALAESDAIFCCGQEGRFFTELAAEIGVDAPLFLDLRDRAGWSREGQNASQTLPKMSALVAEAQLTTPPAKSLDITSEGLCLILGPEDVALAAAEKLQEILGVTVLLSGTEAPPLSRGFDAIQGRLRSARGALGHFAVTVDALQQADTAGRALRWTTPQDGGRSACDILRRFFPENFKCFRFNGTWEVSIRALIFILLRVS